MRSNKSSKLAKGRGHTCIQKGILHCSGPFLPLTRYSTVISGVMSDRSRLVRNWSARLYVGIAYLYSLSITLLASVGLFGLHCRTATGTFTSFLSPISSMELSHTHHLITCRQQFY